MQSVPARLLIALSLAPPTGPAGAMPDPGEPAPTRADTIEGLCQGAQRARVELDPSEFHLQAYDTRGQILAIHAEPELAAGPRRPVGLRLTRLAQDLLLPLPPEAFGLVRDEHEAGRLKLVLTVRRSARDSAEPTPSACAGGLVDVEPTVARLLRDDFVLAEQDLDTPPKPRRIAYPEVVVGPMRTASGCPRAQHERLSGAVHETAVGCLRAAMRDVHSLNGAMMVELERSPVGEPQPPRIRVDAVVFTPLSNCLTQALAEAEDVWNAVPPGGKVWFPLYFRGSPVTLPPDEAPAAPLTSPVSAP